MTVSEQSIRVRPAGTPSLIGRRAELGALERAMDALDSGSCGALLIAGEPGIGKTRLLAQLCAQGQDRGHLVLPGRAAQCERDLPFGMFVAALDDHCGAQQAAELARILPSLAPLASQAQPAALPVERHRAYRAARTLLETWAGHSRWCWRSTTCRRRA
ncbi:MAG: ATP-binding protein [Egibacteraceae bacterium]